MDHRSSIIANPDGDSWDFAKRVFEYVKKRESEAVKKERENFLARVSRGLSETFPGEPMTERLKFASVLYEAEKNGETSQFELNPLELTVFPDDEYRSLIKNNIRGSNCFFIHDSNLRPKYWHSQLEFTDNALRLSSANRIINVLPYLKFSRQDRKDVSRTSINAQAIARISVDYNAGVVTVDVHNKAIQGMYHGPSYSESFDSLDSFPTLLKHLQTNHPELLENLVVLLPDEGASKRFGDYVKRYGFETALVDKYRDKTTGKTEIRGICGDVRNKNVLSPDDIAASGGTQIATAIVAKQLGARTVSGYVTFALATNGIEKVAAQFDNFFVSDIIRQPYKKNLYKPEKPFAMPGNVEYVSFVPLIGEAIYRISNNESLSELF